MLNFEKIEYTATVNCRQSFSQKSSKTEIKIFFKNPTFFTLSFIYKKIALQIFVLICKNVWFCSKFKWEDFDEGAYGWFLSKKSS